MSNQTRILVTAIGGDLSQAIIKCLRISQMPIYIFGCDSTFPNSGEAFVDNAVQVALPKDRHYISELEKICDKHNIEVVIPACEPEIELLNRTYQSLTMPNGTKIISHPYSKYQIHSDKLLSYKSLQEKVELSWFVDGSDSNVVDEIESNNRYPVIIKPRRSSGSKGICIANNQSEVLEGLNNVNMPLIQEYIDDKFGEYSVCIYMTEKDHTGIAFRRKLGNIGASWYAENQNQPAEVLDYALQIATHSGLQGSINIQVRFSSIGVRLLEINPRFSSLAAARAVCGFRDVEWSIYHTIHGNHIEIPKEYDTIRFQRFFHELIDFGEGYVSLHEWQPKTIKHNETSFSPVKKFI